MQSEVVIVGAGPYGLSLAAHLRAQGVSFRIFGKPMETWLTQMPAGMSLKSEGFASNLADADDRWTLGRYCGDHGLAYQDTGLPVALEIFQAYGQAFQRRYLPDLDTRRVISVTKDDEVFEVTLEDGETCRCARVVLAVGISHYAHMPPALKGLPKTLAGHTSDNADLSVFAGQRVAVLGAGASALDTFKLLLDHGCDAELVARTSKIRFHQGPPKGARRLIDRVRAPMSGLGPGWKSRLCTDAPLLFHAMPSAFRHKVVRRHLGPAPCWWTNDDKVRHAPMHLATIVEHVVRDGAGLALHLCGPAGARIMHVDHVIAGTGYQVNLERLEFLARDLLSAIRTDRGAPALSRNFEASVPGLYFVGLSAAASFGPLLRFAFGARYAARRLSQHLRKRARAERLIHVQMRAPAAYHASPAREAIDA